MEKMSRKIKDAVLKGINEAFDINDMGNAIETVPSRKRAVGKASKLYKELNAFVNSHDFSDLRKICNVLDQSDKDFLVGVYDTIDGITDKDALALAKKIPEVVYQYAKYCDVPQSIIDCI